MMKSDPVGEGLSKVKQMITKQPKPPFPNSIQDQLEENAKNLKEEKDAVVESINKFAEFDAESADEIKQLYKDIRTATKYARSAFSKYRIDTLAYNVERKLRERASTTDDFFDQIENIIAGADIDKAMRELGISPAIYISNLKTNPDYLLITVNDKASDTEKFAMSHQANIQTPTKLSLVQLMAEYENEKKDLKNDLGNIFAAAREINPNPIPEYKALLNTEDRLIAYTNDEDELVQASHNRVLLTLAIIRGYAKQFRDLQIAIEKLKKDQHKIEDDLGVWRTAYENSTSILNAKAAEIEAADKLIEKKNETLTNLDTEISSQDKVLQEGIRDRQDKLDKLDLEYRILLDKFPSMAGKIDKRSASDVEAYKSPDKNSDNQAAQTADKPADNVADMPPENPGLKKAIGDEEDPDIEKEIKEKAEGLTHGRDEEVRIQKYEENGYLFDSQTKTFVREEPSKKNGFHLRLKFTGNVNGTVSPQIFNKIKIRRLREKRRQESEE